jgi:hypothetical protein
LISWSVVTRYTNLPVAVILALHYSLTTLISLTKGATNRIRFELPAVVIGIGLPLAVLLFYNNSVFGSPFSYGYQYTRFPIKFAFQYLGQVNRNGQSIPLQIIANNLKTGPRALLLGFPLLLVGIPGFFIIWSQKIFDSVRLGRSLTNSPRPYSELPRDILLILTGWFISVFVLYLTYEWTAEFPGNGSFIIFDRFYLPGIFPVAVISALTITRFPHKLHLPVLLLIILLSSLLYFQSILNWDILPGWLQNGRPGGRRDYSLPKADGVP